MHLTAYIYRCIRETIRAHAAEEILARGEDCEWCSKLVGRGGGGARGAIARVGVGATDTRGQKFEHDWGVGISGGYLGMRRGKGRRVQRTRGVMSGVRQRSGGVRKSGRCNNAERNGGGSGRRGGSCGSSNGPGSRAVGVGAYSSYRGGVEGVLD